MFTAYCRQSLPPCSDFNFNRTSPPRVPPRYAYDDWHSRGRPTDSILAYRDHYGTDDHTGIFFRPDLGVLTVTTDGDYFDAALSASVVVDNGKRTVELRSVFCRSENYWPEIFFNGGPPSGSGGLPWLRTVEEYFRGCQPFEISLESAVSALFGPGWTVVVPPTVETLSAADAKALADACDALYRSFMAESWFPWGRTVGLYDTRRSVAAATTIQRWYRGWRVRMRTAFDPNTRLGRFYVLREFQRKLLRS